MKKNGFTLIELLIVIAIIGILASIVIVSLGSARESARIATFKEKIHSIQTSAISQCDSLAADNDPVTLRGLIEADNGGGLPAGTAWVTGGSESADCGSSGSSNFLLEVDSGGTLVVECTATIEDTGVTSFTGC